MERCLGCMELIDDQAEVCPLCGYFKGSGVKEAYYLEPGTVLKGQYLLGKVLGYGGFGVTYIGYDNKLQRKIAVKEYLPSDYATRKPGTKEPVIYSGDAREQFMAGLSSFLGEARNLAGFGGIPEIVDIYDCFKENGTGYIVMEYLKGKTVKELLAREGRFPYQKAEEIILHVLDGLEAVHKEGIIHRDIAPDNIFVTDEGEIKLLDFGAARYAASIYSRSLSVILKPGYAPEEQYRSHGQQGPWTDIYGVGATFYRMITGERPPESLERMIVDDLKRPSELGMEIPPEKEEILMKSLKVQMEDRIQSAEEFKEELTKVPDKLQKEDKKEKDKKEKDKKEKEQIKKEQRRKDGGSSGGTGRPEKPAGGKLLIKLGIACCVVGICVVGFYFGRDIIGSDGSEEQSESIAQSESESKAESERLQSEEESKAESERLQSEEESKAESERLQSEEESKAESERLQSEEESKAESERLQSEEELKEESEAESTAQSEKESEAESTAQSERESEKQSEADAKNPAYQLVFSLEDKSQQIAMTDETGIKADELIIKDAEDNVIYSRENPVQERKVELTVEEGKQYHIQLSNTKTGVKLGYYNLPLSNVKKLRLKEKDGYAYSIYRTVDTNEKVDTEQYAVKTYDEEQIRYLIRSGLSIRSVPDNQGNEPVSSLDLGDVVTVCGLAKGRIDGEERDWYLIRTDEGYAYISASDTYTSDNEADVPEPEPEQTPEPDYTQSQNYYTSPQNYSDTPPASVSDGIDWEDGGIVWE